MVRSSLVKCERIDAHTSALSSRKDAATKFFMHASYVASVHAARAYSAGTQYFRLSIRRRARRACSIISRPISPDPLHALKARVSDLRPRHAAGHQPIRRIDIEACSSPIEPTIVTFLFHLFFEPSLLNFQVSFFFFFFRSVKFESDIL